MSIIFNVLYWYENDENSKYIIRMFGRTEEGLSVALKVTDFIPYFYVEIPNDWDDKKKEEFVRKIKIECEKQDKGNYNIKHLKKYEFKNFHKFYYFTKNKRFNFIRFIFDSYRSMKRLARLFDNTLFLDSFDKNITDYPVYESNIEPFLRFIHIKDINSAGWVKIDNYETNYDDICKTDISIKCIWNNVKSLKDKVEIANFKIASFDIECTSGDGSFPQASRPEDKIIQIGTVFGRYGLNDIYKKNIITLKSCASIEGTEVESYETEKEVLEAWQKLIEREDPDIITGYNIFYFDEKYMYDRAQMFNCYETSGKLSKLVNKVCEWNESKLSSSALGDNILRYFKMIGRVQIDLMKVIQRDYKLDSYKLDSVAEHFIKEKINKIIKIDDTHYKLITKNTIKQNNYIRIEENDDSMDDKFIVIEVVHDGFIIETKENLEYDDNSKLFWCLVKDDIHAKDIFRLQKGNAFDRAEIAKYCIQDCVLVLKILYKLEIITNNISMANVCSVPISYIFLRGQGIKSLSLVSKECRLKEYLIPTIKKKEDSNEDESFEGAIVFEPEIGFHTTPITVLDFNSLYPSSIIAKNVSHETLKHSLLDDDTKIIKLMNHEGYEDPKKSDEYTYNDVKYDDVICTYSKYKNEFGILPNILLKLLAERKTTKKIMEKEIDPFKKTILDGKQLALKITANSLYGQLGASTSPIYLKKLAASTTAIGRNMLETAREFVETNLPDILEELYKNKDKEIDTILDKELEDRQNKDFVNMLMNTVNEIYNEHIIRPKENIKKIKKLDNNEFKLLDKKYFMKYKIFSDIPPYIKVGNRIRFEYDNKMQDERFTILQINKNNFEIGIIDDSKYFIEYEKFDINKLKWVMCMIIYGDSVMPYTPILIKYNDNINIVTIENIKKIFNNKWVDYPQFKPNDIGLIMKQQFLPNDLQVWTNGKWSKIVRVIRHKTIKKIYRVTTQQGLVDVTEDHSLITNQGELIKPDDCKKNTLLLQSLPDIKENKENNINNEEAYILGVIFGCDACNKYQTIIEKLLSSNYKSLIEKYKNLCYENKVKIVPNIIINSNKENKINFLNGYFDTKIKIGIFINQITAQSYYLLLHSLKYNVYINNNNNKYIIEYTMEKLHDTNSIKNKILLKKKYNGYVYDLETEEGIFQAGIGSIVVKNTDSIFIRMNMINKSTKELLTNNQSLKWSINLGQIASKLLKNRLPYPQNMEYEKTFYPFCILAKKKYVGNKYENDPSKFKQACMGIVLKRRDNPPIVKKIIGGMLDIMLNYMDKEQVIQYVKNSIEDLLNGKYSIKNFITSKALRDGYKYKDGDIDKDGNEITKTISIIDTFNNIHTIEAKKIISYVKQAHVQLAARMAERDPGNKPQLNDRIPYVAIEVLTDKKLLQGDLIEHPEYIIKNNLQVNYLFYLTNQIMNPSIQFLELITDEPNKIFKEYCDKTKINKERIIIKKKEDELVSSMITNYGFKMSNEDWDINIDGLIKQVKEQPVVNKKLKTKKTKK